MDTNLDYILFKVDIGDRTIKFFGLNTNLEFYFYFYNKYYDIIEIFLFDKYN